MPSGARTLSLAFLGLSRNLAEPIANATSAAPRNRRLKASFRGTTPEWPTGKKPPLGSRLSGREPSAPEVLPHPEESLFQRQAALAAAAAAERAVAACGGAFAELPGVDLAEVDLPTLSSASTARPVSKVRETAAAGAPQASKTSAS